MLVAGCLSVEVSHWVGMGTDGCTDGECRCRHPDRIHFTDSNHSPGGVPVIWSLFSPFSHTFYCYFDGIVLLRFINFKLN